MRKVLYMFSELSDTDIEWLASAGRRIGFAKGEVLIEEGRPPSDIFVLLERELSVVTRCARTSDRHSLSGRNRRRIIVSRFASAVGNRRCQIEFSYAGSIA